MSGNGTAESRSRALSCLLVGYAIAITLSTFIVRTVRGSSSFFHEVGAYVLWSRLARSTDLSLYFITTVFLSISGSGSVRQPLLLAYDHVHSCHDARHGNRFNLLFQYFLVVCKVLCRCFLTALMCLIQVCPLFLL